MAPVNSQRLGPAAVCEAKLQRNLPIIRVDYNIAGIRIPTVGGFGSLKRSVGAE